MKNEKRVYTFGNGQAEGRADMRNLLGGKGANLAEMNLIGVPVPPGFTITTDVCNEYYEIGKEKVVELLRTLKLLAKVLVPTQSTVAGLLADNTVPAQAKAQLQAFARKTEEEKLTIEKAD